MQYFPAFMKLEGGSCLIVGGGEAALAKLRLLEKGTGSITLVAPRILPAIEEVVRCGRVIWEARPFTGEDVRDRRLVFAATGRGEVDERVSVSAQAAGVPVNVVDGPAASSFITPAIVDRDPILIGVSSAGTAPILARSIRAQLEALLPAELGRLARFADSFRGAVKAVIPSFIGRRRFWEDFFASPVARQVLAGQEQQAREAMLSRINRGQGSTAQGTSVEGSVALVGAGPGDPELLTLKAQRLLQGADLIVYDRLVNPAILEHARRDAERLFVGKTPAAHHKTGSHQESQGEIQQILLQAVRNGRRVVRLKGGDPFVFGRGGEELSYLEAAGVTVEVVPGITAATGCAASGRIPLTQRGLAQSVTFVTGQGEQAASEPDWQSLARLGGTLCFYMGVATADRIAEKLMVAGMNGATPVTVVEKGTLPEERCLPGRLDGLPALIAAEAVEAPALIVIGEVAGTQNINRLPSFAAAV